MALLKRAVCGRITAVTQWAMNFAFVVLMCHGALALGDSRRAKRLLFGTVLEKKDAPYKAADYFVWLGRIWDCYEDVQLWRRLLPLNLYVLGIPPCGKEKPNRGRFGGALITPYIVQTACHVLVYFRDRKNHKWGTTEIMRIWENKMQVYMGQTDVREFRHPILVSHYVVHYNCAQLQRWPHYARYDIGWVVLENTVPGSKGVSTGKWGRLEYAGPYKLAQLREFHDRIVSQMHVCLLIGFGVTLYTRGAPMSRYLNHGWVQLMDYYTCYLISYKLLYLDGIYNYNKTISWVCSTPMRKPSGTHHTYGDSGTPISCDNIYFAVVSGTVGFEGDGIAGVTKLSMDTAIKYTPEANAVEYRREFEDDVSYQGRYEPKKANSVLEHDESLRYSFQKYFHKKPAQVPSSAAPAASSGNSATSLSSSLATFLLWSTFVIIYLNATGKMSSNVLHMKHIWQVDVEYRSPVDGVLETVARNPEIHI